MADIESEFVHLARLALEESRSDVTALIRRAIRPIIRHRPDLADLAKRVLALAAQDGLARAQKESHPLPVDLDSRLELLRREPIPEMGVEPTWPAAVAQELTAVLDERRIETELRDAGVGPSRSLLLVGPPGVGKTLAARWMARQLNRTLLTLDLAAVMSSFLGRTGNNIRLVLDYARHTPSVLLLDEFDAIEKRRDDTAEVGELKRLVTVLLQAVDDWPTEGILIAATNHPDLLDPAVWRRFDRLIKFPLPSFEDIMAVLATLLSGDSDGLSTDRATILAALFRGSSFADITREIQGAKRSAIVKRIPLPVALDDLAARLSHQATTVQRIEVARTLQRQNISQRSISRTTGLSRDTIRKRLPESANRNHGGS